MEVVTREEFERTQCCSCAIQFYVPQAWINKRREDHEWFFCPNGHRLHFTAQTEAEKLRLERDRLKQEQARILDELLAANKARADAEAQAARTLKRAKAGVCQCCNRSFANVARHMASKHPEVIPMKRRIA